MRMSLESPRTWKMSLFGVMFALITCAARRPALEPPGLVQEAEVAALEDRSEAISILEASLEAGPADADEPWILLWLGEQHRLNRDPEQARRHFEQLAEQYPTHDLKEAALLGMAVVDADSNPSGNTLATLQLLDADGAPNTLNADRYRILARIAADDDSNPTRVRELVERAITYAESDPSVKIRIHQTLGDLLTNDQASTLTGVDFDEVGTGAGAELGVYERAEQALERDDYEEAIELSRRFLEVWPDSDLKPEVENFIKRAEKGDPLSSRKVGVLLPMTGRYAPAAQQVREVIELANRRAGSPMELVFADTQGDAAVALSELDRLALDEGCVAVMGPLLRELVMPAAEAAQALHLPLVTLSQYQDPTSAGPYVYRGFLPLSHQIDALIDHAIQDRGYERFAVLYPDNSYGQAARDLFTASANARGATVVRRQSYDPAATAFLDVARQLGDKTRSSRNSDEARNPPTIDYDALFIPDNHTRVALVASSLAYEEFPVGGFRPTYASRGLLLMGLNGWNNPALVESGGQYVQGSIFVDTFWNQSTDESVVNFVSEYEASFGRTPGVIDAVTYDATRLLGAAVAANSGGRRDLLSALSNVWLQDPVSAGHRFGTDREVERELLILTVTPSGIRTWSQPE